MVLNKHPTNEYMCFVISWDTSSLHIVLPHRSIILVIIKLTHILNYCYHLFGNALMSCQMTSLPLLHSSLSRQLVNCPYTSVLNISQLISWDDQLSLKAEVPIQEKKKILRKDQTPLFKLCLYVYTWLLTLLLFRGYCIVEGLLLLFIFENY